jgi:mannose-1-phosphate guanylyltransferase
MKVILLAGGRGTRAMPFSLYSPKSMIPINGRPVIDHITRYLANFSIVEDFIIVCEFDHLGTQIVNYFEGKEHTMGKKIIFVEDNKNGTGGAILSAESLVKDDDFFAVWFADNLCALDVDHLIHEYELLEHKQINDPSKFIGIIATREHRKEETGIVVLDPNDKPRIKEFVEKPLQKLESPETLGIYLFSKNLLNFIHMQKEASTLGDAFDLSYEVLSQIPRVGSKIFSYTLPSDRYWIDVESPTHADRNKDLIKKILSQMKMKNRSNGISRSSLK